MKNNTLRQLLFSALSFCAIGLSAQPIEKELIMWYNEPAREWVEALPVGNGRLGAMVSGGTDQELIRLNESTLWAGGPVELNPNPEARSYLAEVRKQLFAGNYGEADELCKKMQGHYTESYAPMGDLHIRQYYPGEVVSHYRDLNLADAIASTHFCADGITFKREVFASAPDQVIVVRLTADRKGALNLDAKISSQLSHHLSQKQKNTLVLDGRAPAHADPNYVTNNATPIVYQEDKGMRFRLLCKAIPTDGEVTADSTGLHIRNATEVTLLLSAATSYNGFDTDPVASGKDEKKLADGYLRKAEKRSFDHLLKRHLQDYQSLFNRVTFQLKETKPSYNQDLSTRLDAYLHGADDKALETLYFQYGRYLLISASRPGGIAANLQGIWNSELRPPWSSNYTTNINAQMNYWPAEVCNLSELHEPFLQQISHMARNGTATAQNFYGTRGWCLHHNSDIWAQTNPVGNIGQGSPVWANWMMGSPWVSQHLYEHYLFTGDRKYLKNFAYPILKGAAQFAADWLIEDEQGYLITAPSSSPENTFIDPQGKSRGIGIGTTSDLVLIRDLFTNVIEASKLLGIDEAFRDTLQKKKSALYPLQIGKKGNLQEWYKDFEDAEPRHRHISHLIGLYPGREIDPLTDTKFAQACKRSLELRGDDGTGWALGWKINAWARLLDGNHAYKLLRNLLRVTGNRETEYNRGGGSYRNLFCAHPPFQIDGNFGGTAGIAEMLLQSQTNEIHLLPALPEAWPEGSMTGLRARGNFVIDMFWQDLQLKKGAVLSRNGGICRIRTHVPIRITGVQTEVITEKAASGAVHYITIFDTQKGKQYNLQSILN